MGPATAAVHPGRFHDPSVDAPTVTSVSPPNSEELGGTWLTIYGSNFDATSQVVIGQGDGPYDGSIPATDVVVISPSELLAETGVATTAGTFNTFVITDNGISAANSADLFTYEADVS